MGCLDDRGFVALGNAMNGCLERRQHVVQECPRGERRVPAKRKERVCKRMFEKKRVSGERWRERV